MAKLIQAIGAYGPRIKLGLTAGLEELTRFIAGRTGLNEGSILLVLKELRDAVVFFHLAGRSVKMEGLGIYTPSIDLPGVFDVGHRLDPRLRDELNKPNAFKGEIVNNDMVGKTSGDLKTRWNEEHPEDPIP
ncbi:MAG: hypothetical protein GTO45_26755 [Candidatus Aminicenantes bacterium]|nr:hypothetical protein [Candidatus Aminicenantes bacterium]NIM82346.1 hypothetical protein [Candidatus Aminicenantes bacterium]NIN21729.1 hypothetical protein [Candidatus Aminicenantes bacterium]NIN45538.1 hypothetical protein [Candidatus Aminicenantes bacterium]NIN88369.1 hypothetical protein [Candidatus Aminicenantes bacterium]